MEDVADPHAKKIYFLQKLVETFVKSVIVVDP
jgi:hypothetical protein